MLVGIDFANSSNACFAALSLAMSINWSEEPEATNTPSTYTLAIFFAPSLQGLMVTSLPCFAHCLYNVSIGWGCCCKTSSVTIGFRRSLKIFKYKTINDEFYINREKDREGIQNKNMKKDKSFLPNKKREVKYAPPIIFADRNWDQNIQLLPKTLQCQQEPLGL